MGFAPFPTTPLGEAVDLLAQAKPDPQTGAFSIDDFATAAGLRYALAAQKLHDLKLYGLVEPHKDHVDLWVATDGARLLLGGAGPERAQAAEQALIAPDVFGKLHARLARAGIEVPDVVAQLGGLGVPTEAQRQVAENYLASRAYVDGLRQ